MSKVIFTAFMVAFLGMSLGLAGCEHDGGYYGDRYDDDYDGHHKHWKQRALEPKGHFSSESDFPASSLSGGQ